MGGNALKNVETRRVDSNEFQMIRNTILDTLKIVFFFEDTNRKRKINDLPYYTEKSSFGDLDILIESFSGDNIKYVEMINRVFHPKEIVQNSNCYSFDYLDFQIDLILIPTQDYDTSLTYYAWNDLGNLAGRIFKKLGFKYGHKGLSYMFRKDDSSHSVFDEVIVTKDIQQIFEFGDLNYERFCKGFNNLEEMFRWVSSSKYFHKDIYLLHNRNHKSRIRDKKRPVYNTFVQWCSVTTGLNEYPWTQMKEQDGYAGKPEFIKLAINKFTGFGDVYSKTNSKYNNEKLAKQKFNGDIIYNITKLKGKYLGEFMRYFIDVSGGKDKWFNEILNKTSDEIEFMIKYEYAKFKNF